MHARFVPLMIDACEECFSSAEVWQISQQPLLFSTMQAQHLSVFGHVTRVGLYLNCIPAGRLEETTWSSSYYLDKDITTQFSQKDIPFSFLTLFTLLTDKLTNFMKIRNVKFVIILNSNFDTKI